MRVTITGRSCVLPLATVGLALALNGCAAGTPSSTEAQVSNAQSTRWSEDNLVQPNQLLPNGLRPLRYFYW